MLENKSSIFSNLTDKIQKLRLVFITKFLFSVIYFVSHESKFCFELWIILEKKRKVSFVSKTQQFQIQDMFENGSPDIVLKTVQRCNIKRTSIIISIFKKSFKTFNKMLVIVFIIVFYFGYGPGSQNRSLSICANFLEFINGPSVSL